MSELDTILDMMTAAARDGGAIALPYFRKGASTSANVAHKAEGSPVTEADIAVDRFLEQRFRSAFPQAGWLSEESVDDPARLAKSRVFIVDPIDGTRGFVSGDDSWCVSIGLVENGRPIAGALYAPARDEMFAARIGQPATLNGTPLTPPLTNGPLRYAGPPGVAQKLIGIDPEAWTAHRKVPSLAYRLILLTTGAISIASASKACHDWDIAAADIILSQCGLALRDLEGRAPVYNRENPVHPPLVAGAARLFPAAGLGV